MDPAMMSLEVAVGGYGAVTALGCGVKLLEEAISGNSRALRPCARFTGRGYQSDVMGGISDAVWEEVACRGPRRQGSTAFLLAAAAAEEARSWSAELWSTVPPERTALVLSTTKADILSLESVMGGTPSHSADSSGQLFPARLAADLAAFFGILGPVQCVSLACTSGVMAIQQGCSLIGRGQADLVLVVGVDVLSHFVLSGFSSLKSLDPAGCRPFDATRSGLSLGEGAGAILLARKGMGGRRMPFIKGWGSSNDANHLTGPSRDGAGLALAMERALSSARVPAGQIGYVNVHGTGTVYNDAMESLALRKVFGEKVPPFSSQKGMFGHTLGAAGVIETIVCCVAGRSGELPGTPGLSVADPVVPQSILSLPAPGVFPRHILKINSGFGGVNAALVIEMRDI